MVIMTREEAKQATIEAILSKNESEIGEINSQIEMATQRGEFQLDILGSTEEPSVIPSHEVQLFLTQNLGYTIKPILKYEESRETGNITYQGVSIIWGDEPKTLLGTVITNNTKTC